MHGLMANELLYDINTHERTSEEQELYVLIVKNNSDEFMHVGQNSWQKSNLSSFWHSEGNLTAETPDLMKCK